MYALLAVRIAGSSTKHSQLEKETVPIVRCIVGEEVLKEYLPHRIQVHLFYDELCHFLVQFDPFLNGFLRHVSGCEILLDIFYKLSHK